MRIRVGSKLKVLAVTCLLASAGAAAIAQEQIESELSAKQRILPAIGPGLQAIRRSGDGRLYVLASPTPGLLVFNSAGKQVLSIAEFSSSTAGANASPALISFGDDCDVDADGKIYVADRGANLIQIGLVLGCRPSGGVATAASTCWRPQPRDCWYSTALASRFFPSPNSPLRPPAPTQAPR